MYIKSWGSRGSIPVSGRNFVKYGGDTTCLEIRPKSGDLIIVDAGTGIRRLGNKLIHENSFHYNFLFTHAHWDHLMGFPFFKPIYTEHSIFRMHRCPFPSKYVGNMLSRVMTPPNFPVRYSDLKAEIVHEDACEFHFVIGSMEIIPIPLSHPNTGSGYKFIEDGKTFVFLTDNELGFIHPKGLPFEAYVEFCEGADLLLHDAEYTPGEYQLYIEYGHSSYMDTLQLAMEAGVKNLGLFHLNQDRKDRDMDWIVRHCRDIVSEKGVKLHCFGVSGNTVIKL